VVLFKALHLILRRQDDSTSQRREEKRGKIILPVTVIQLEGIPSAVCPVRKDGSLRYLGVDFDGGLLYRNHVKILATEALKVPT